LRALGVGVAVLVVAELGEHPGAEHDAEAGLAEVDLSVRVLTKMCLDLLLHGLDLAVEGAQDRHLGAHGGRVGSRHDRGLAQVLGAQRGGDRVGFRGPAVAAGTLERGGDLLDAQRGGRGGVRGGGEQFQRVGGGEVVEGDQRGREELAQRVA
jgi:hypothetical protein